jgi:hypothetical protein
MMYIETTSDCKLIASLMMHPDLFDRITDDEGANMTITEIVKFLSDKLDRTLFLLIKDDVGTIRGFFECGEQEDGSFELHPNMLKIGRGAFAIWAAKRVIKSLFTKTKTPALRGRIPSKYLDVLLFTSALGFKLDYMVEKEYVKDGLEYDMYYMTMSRST